MSNDRPQNSKPTLENLLELKRRERPPEAFWNEFDARLREKQLAALIPVESGWSRWFGGVGRFAKLGLPIAAAAAVAVGIVSINRQLWQQAPVTATEDGAARHDTASLSESGPRAVDLADAGHRDNDVRTVVIEAAPSVAELAARTPNSAQVGTRIDAEQIARTLPWLANVDFKRDANDTGINLVEPLNIDRGPTAMAMNSFGSIKPSAQPVWVPTEQNIREAVASEIGIAPTRGDKANRAWMTRVIASNAAARFVGSHVESEYPRELTRVGLTGSTLSIKF